MKIINKDVVFAVSLIVYLVLGLFAVIAFHVDGVWCNVSLLVWMIILMGLKRIKVINNWLEEPFHIGKK